MAPLPTIANVIRVGLRWNPHDGVQPYNVMHVATNTTDLEQLALDLGDSWQDAGAGVFVRTCSGFTMTTVDLTPLDGVTATQQWPLGHTLSGGTDGESIPATCAVLSLKTNQRGPRGRGRLYLGPLAEGAQSNGLVNGPDTVSAAWRAFNTALAATDSAASMVVASYTHADAGAVTSMHIDAACGTQRRRQRQLQR